MTEHKKILCYLEDLYPQWIAGHDLVKVNTDYGWLGDRATRSLRELAEEGKLERKYDGPKNYVYYRIKKEGQQTLL